MDPSLYEAASSGDVNFLSRIDASIDPLHQKTPKDNNVLHIAAEFKQIDFFKHVKLKHKSPPFWVSNKKGDTPLHVAVRVGCDEIVKFVINHTKLLPHEGADEESGIADGVEAYKQLLRMKNLENETVLHVAVRYCHDKVVSLIIEADPELCCSTNRAEESPLFLAIRKRSPSIASYILTESASQASPNYFQGINGVTALHAAVTQEHLTIRGIVTRMVATNSEIIRKPDALGWTPLHYAALRGNLEATRVLISLDSSISYILDKSGLSPLHVAAYAGHEKVMEELIRCRPDTCDLVNDNGQTALHAAVVGGQSNVVKYILKTHRLAPLINEADKDGNTPLHLAAIHQNRIVIRILTQDRRVDMFAINKESSTALDIFLGKNVGKQEIVDNSWTILADLKCSVSVPFLQQQIKRDLQNMTSPSESSETLSMSGKKQMWTQANWDHHQPLQQKNDNKLLVATLIATVTFAAGFTNVPGGFKSDGSAVLYERVEFGLCQIFNMLSFNLAVLAIFNESTPLTALSIHLPTPTSLIQFSMAGMVLAFYTGMSALVPKQPHTNLVEFLFGRSHTDIAFGVIGLIFLFLVFIPVLGFMIQINRVKRTRMLLNRII